MKAAADAAGVTLMVAYPKRYDPAFERFRDVAANVAEPRLMRVTTFESPFLPYVAHYALAPVAPIPKDAIATFTAETQASITRAIGEANPFLREEYHLVLLDTLVHELNTVRGVLGEPTSLEYVDMQPGQLTVILKFGELSVPINWMDLPGITRYGMEFALYGPEQRVTLSFPSPFLRSAPATVEIVEGEAGTTKSRSISEITSYDSAFKLELEAFHRCVVTGDAPATAPKTPFMTSRCARRSSGSSKTRDRLRTRARFPRSRPPTRRNTNMSSSEIIVANAPVSYGAFEVTIGFDPNVPDGDEILDQVAAAGYAGIDLGPVGYLGTTENLGSKLAKRNLGLAGAYLELPYADPEMLEKTLPELDAMLDIFDAIKPLGLGPDPRPTLADLGVGDGADFRRNNPGSGARNPASGYTEEQWAEFARGMAVVVDRCRSRGYQPVFHNETGTFVEAPEEVGRMLEVSEIGLCMDAGHFLVGGGDPVEYVKKWANRIDHVHIKTADLPRFQQIVDEGLPTNTIWEREVFPKLGEGALDVDAFLAALREIDYAGWLVVEQDIFPTTAERFAQAAADQRANREFLRERGL